MSPPISPPSEPEEPTGSDPYYGWNVNGQWTAGGWDVEPESGPSKTHKSNPSIARSPGPDEMGAHIEYPPQQPKEVPLSVFDPLVHILLESKRRSMGWSKLGEEMARHKSVYKEAGVKNLKEYVSLAVKRELIIAGGIDNNQYVRMHPKLKKNEAK
jgi:hypothetical protein